MGRCRACRRVLHTPNEIVWRPPADRIRHQVDPLVNRYHRKVPEGESLKIPPRRTYAKVNMLCWRGRI